MTRVTTLVLALTLAGVISPSSPCLAAPAIEADAAQLFRAGRAAYERGDFEAAGRAFEEAHRKVPRGAAIYNAARAWQAAGASARAANAYAEALARGDLAADQRTHAERTLDTLRSNLGEVVWQRATDGTPLTIDGEEIPPRASSWFVDPGRHEIGAGEARQTVEVRAGERARVALAAPPSTKPPEVTPLPPAPPPPAAETTRADLVARPPQPTAPGGLGAVGWTALGMGVVAGGTAAALGALTLDARNDFEASGNTDKDLHDKAVSLRTATNVAIGVAVVATGVAVWRYLARRAPEGAGR